MDSQNRQSKDFNEIWNVQTEMNVTQEKWDSIFHNWEEPWNCNGNKKPIGCIICDEIKKTGEDPKGNSFILVLSTKPYKGKCYKNIVLNSPSKFSIANTHIKYDGKNLEINGKNYILANGNLKINLLTNQPIN